MNDIIAMFAFIAYKCSIRNGRKSIRRQGSGRAINNACPRAQKVGGRLPAVFSRLRRQWSQQSPIHTVHVLFRSISTLVSLWFCFLWMLKVSVRPNSITLSSSRAASKQVRSWSQTRSELKFGLSSSLLAAN